MIDTKAAAHESTLISRDALSLLLLFADLTNISIALCDTLATELSSGFFWRTGSR